MPIFEFLPFSSYFLAETKVCSESQICDKKSTVEGEKDSSCGCETSRSHDRDEHAGPESKQVVFYVNSIYVSKRLKTFTCPHTLGENYINK